MTSQLVASLAPDTCQAKVRDPYAASNLAYDRKCTQPGFQRLMNNGNVRAAVLALGPRGSMSEYSHNVLRAFGLAAEWSDDRHYDPIVVPRSRIQAACLTFAAEVVRKVMVIESPDDGLRDNCWHERSSDADILQVTEVIKRLKASRNETVRQRFTGHSRADEARLAQSPVASSLAQNGLGSNGRRTVRVNWCRTSSLIRGSTVLAPDSRPLSCPNENPTPACSEQTRYSADVASAEAFHSAGRAESLERTGGGPGQAVSDIITSGDRESGDHERGDLKPGRFESGRSHRGK